MLLHELHIHVNVGMLNDILNMTFHAASKAGGSRKGLIVVSMTH